MQKKKANKARRAAGETSQSTLASLGDAGTVSSFMDTDPSSLMQDTAKDTVKDTVTGVTGGAALLDGTNAGGGGGGGGSGGGGGGGGGDVYREGEEGEEDLHDAEGVMIPGRAGGGEGDEGEEEEEDEEEGEEGGDPALMSYTYPRRHVSKQPINTSKQPIKTFHRLSNNLINTFPRRPRLDQRPSERVEMRAVEGSDRQAGGFWGTGETAL